MARFALCGVLLAALALFVAPVHANIPDPGLSTTDDVIRLLPANPGGANVLSTTSITVVVNGPSGPVIGSNVEVRFSAFSEPLICWCSGQAHPIASGTTDGTGTVVFQIFGGGCVDPADANASAAVVAEVFADGIKLAELGAVSYDVVNTAGEFYDGSNFDLSCATGLSDATFHSSAIVGSYNYCSDMDGDGDVDVSDASGIADHIVNATSCTP